MALYFGNAPMTAGFCNGEVTAVYFSDKKVWPAAYDPASDWLYTTDGESVTLLMYTGNMPFLTIPAEIGGLPVTVLGPTACYHTDIRTVRIPAGVTRMA